MAKPLNLTKFPLETVLDVAVNAKTHVGRALATTIDGIDVIILAPNLISLEKAWKGLGSKKLLKLESCPSVAILRREYVKIDDEL